MRYIFVELETALNGAIVPGVYIFDDMDAAMARFHRSLGNHLASKDDYKAIMCYVMAEEGRIVASQRYDFEVI